MATGDGKTIGQRVQDLLTLGIGAVTEYKRLQFGVSDPTFQVQGQTGDTARAGQGANWAMPVGGGVPSWVWAAGVGLIGAAVLVKLLRR